MDDEIEEMSTSKSMPKLNNRKPKIENLPRASSLAKMNPSISLSESKIRHQLLHSKSSPE